MTQDKHQARQQKLKQKIDSQIAAAQIEKGLLLVITGQGKGKSTAGFGVITRAVGHGQRCAVMQFIKGTWECGERNLLARVGVSFHVMPSGFTWETQNKQTDLAALQPVWQATLQALADPRIDVVLLDEITYMLNLGYIELAQFVTALETRPPHQSVIITGRGAHRQLIAMADTVSEIRNVKHAFDAGIKARKGVDW